MAPSSLSLDVSVELIHEAEVQDMETERALMHFVDDVDRMLSDLAKAHRVKRGRSMFHVSGVGEGQRASVVLWMKL